MEELDRPSAEEVNKSAKNPLIVILDDVRSMQNVGSAFRTCDAFAVEAIYLCGFTPQPPHRDIHKSALGATETVNWQHFPTIEDAIRSARNDGYQILAVEQVHNSVMLQNVNYQGTKTALIFGNEVTGVSDKALSLSAGCIEIPQWGAKHSLNISVSIGVTLWELVRVNTSNR